MAYGARLLSGLRVTPSRGFKSRHLRQIPRLRPGSTLGRSRSVSPGLTRCRTADGDGLPDGVSCPLPVGASAMYPPTLNAPTVVIVTGCRPTGTPSR